MAAEAEAGTALHTRACLPCVSKGGDLHLLAGDVVTKLHAQLMPGWAVVDGGNVLERQFQSTNFVTAMAAIQSYGVEAERLGHHPDLLLTSYRTVTVRLYTHALGGLSINDFIVAAHLDRVPVKYSAAWLREHPDTAAWVAEHGAALASGVGA